MVEVNGKLFSYWDDIETVINEIVDKLNELKLPIDSVYGIPRGGLIPAVMLSHKLDLPLVDKPTEQTLIVDDISDTGTTLGEHHLHGAVYTATLHMRKGSTYEPTIYGRFIDSDKWIVYPWESREAKPIQDYKLKNNNI
jgi:hypothetical protein